jgi:pimeloyl-ACP methyl ester carboxylesterase
VDAQVLRLRDGRELAWSESGDREGMPVLAFHGTPGSRNQLLIDDAPMRAAGVRWVAPDRPGYGASTFHAGRTLAGWADDVAQLADHLGVEQFAVVGVSGGGPHAAACAHGLTDRVSAAALVSSVRPLGEPGSEAGMMAQNRAFTRMARRFPAANRLPFGAIARLGRLAPDRLLAAVAKAAPSADAATLARPDVAAAYRRDLAEASRTTGRAATQDFALLAHDWGFRLEDIRVPVHVWQAEGDRNVPLAHARHLAEAIPGAVLHLVADGGHFLVVDHLLAILRAVARPPA